MKTSFTFKRPTPVEYDWNTVEIGDGSLNLPKVREWCLFEFWQRFPMRHKDGSVEHIKAYGYINERAGRKTIAIVPLYKIEVNVCKIARWKYVDMPFNGGLEKLNDQGA